MPVIAGNVVALTTGCFAGGGQDYFRIEGFNGVVEAHPVFDSTRLFSLNQRCSVTVDDQPLPGTYDVLFLGCAVSRKERGVIHEDFIFNSGGNVFSFHLSRALSVPWTSGTLLNIGIRRNV